MMCLNHLLTSSLFLNCEYLVKISEVHILFSQRCKNGELFDYLTSVVALSEKRTKYVESIRCLRHKV